MDCRSISTTLKIGIFLTSITRRVAGAIDDLLASMHGFGLDFFDITTLAFLFIDFFCMVFQTTMYLKSMGMMWMIRIGPLKYVKDDERTILASILVGLVVGLPSGLLLSYLMGFMTNVSLAVSDYIGWTAFFLRLGLILAATSWTTAIIVCLVLCRKRGFKSVRETSKIALGTVFLPLTLMYGLLVLALVNIPIDASLQRYGITHTYTISVLVSIPFLIIYLAIFIPDSNADKALRRFVHHSNGRKRKTGKEENA